MSTKISDQSPVAKGKTESLLFLALFLYFMGKTVYLALRIRERVFADENSWFRISSIFSRVSWLPSDSPESHPFGLVTHIPSLYFLLMGKTLCLNIFGMDDLIFLRLVNTLLGGLTVWFAWKLIQRLSDSLPVRLLFFAMLTNSMMLTFTFSSVSYDNLTTLLAVLTLYFLVQAFQDGGSRGFLLFGLFLLAGCLTKNVFLPYGAGLVLASLVLFRQRLGSLKQGLVSLLSRPGMVNGLLLAGCLVLLAANLKLYAGNMVTYGQLVPTMDQVLPLEDCLKNRLFARNHAAQMYKEGKIGLEEAQRLALQVREPGDRAFAWSLLAKETEERSKPAQRMGRLAYTLEWCSYMVARTYSVAGHLAMLKTERGLLPFEAVFMLAAIMLILRFRSGVMAGINKYLMFVTAFYSIILMQVINYNLYWYSGFAGLSLTGRYLFPVLVPLYLLIAKVFLEKMPRWWQISAGLAIAIIFISGEFPWFLMNLTKEWLF